LVNNLTASQDFCSIPSTLSARSRNLVKHCVAKLNAISHCSVDLRGPERVREPEVDDVLHDRQCHKYGLFTSGLHRDQCDCSTFAERGRNQAGEILRFFATKSENNKRTGFAVGLSRLAFRMTDVGEKNDTRYFICH
jgi:hypothetical protein